MSFADKLHEYRLRAGISQNALALKINIDASYINRIEKGERVPGREVILDIATALSLQESERDELLLSAYYAPELAGKVDLTNPSFRLMAEIWSDDTSDLEDQEERILEILRNRRHATNRSESQ